MSPLAASAALRSRGVCARGSRKLPRPTAQIFIQKALGQPRSSFSMSRNLRFISLRHANRTRKRWLPSCLTKSTDTHHMRDATRINSVCFVALCRQCREFIARELRLGRSSALSRKITCESVGLERHSTRTPGERARPTGHYERASRAGASAECGATCHCQKMLCSALARSRPSISSELAFTATERIGVAQRHAVYSMSESI